MSKARTPRGLGRPRVPWILAAAAAGLAIVAVWGLVGDVPFLRNPFRQVAIPAYLDATAPAVAAARDGAADRLELMARLSGRLSVLETDPQLLWKSLDQFESDPPVKAWSARRTITLAGSEPWPVPTDPDWTEDPYDNVSWLSQYHSLAWLQAPGRLYREERVAEHGREVAHYVLDWIDQNPREAPASRRSWYDHTVAWRTDALVALFDPVLLDALEPAELDIVLGFLWQHGELLYGYLSDPAFVGHNHNLFHALSLYNLAIAFPELDGSKEWRVAAHRRIGTLFGEMFDADGVSTEQAASYHFLALSLFSTAVTFLDAHGDPLEGDMTEELAEAGEFAARMAWPDGTLPPYGDTAVGARANLPLLARLADQDEASDELRFLVSKGAEGQRPADLRVYPGAGYAILRPSYGDVGNWDDDLQVFVDLGRWRRVHGHEDALNVLAWGAGGPLLIDSGGPYAYQDAGRRWFMSPQAHNTVTVDGRGYDVADLEAVDGRLLGSGEHAGISFVDAVHDQWGSVSHRRTVVVVAPSLLVVVDRLTPSDGRRHEYELLWHLPAATSVTAAPGGANLWRGTAHTAVGAAMGVAVAGSAELGHERIEGREDPPLGWVTTGLFQRDPAPVLRHHVTDEVGWFVTVITPAPAGSAPVVTPIAVAEGEDGLVITLELDGRDLRVDFPHTPGQAPRLLAD